MEKALSLLIWICITPSHVSADKLQMVHALWRHGDRSPTDLIPTDVNNTADTWPQGLGELTPIGMRQEFQLGTTLNQLYQINQTNFVSANYSQPEIYVRSDDFNRTLMSAMANLAGFYQNSISQVNITGWPASYWQPIPVHTVALDQDNLINMEANCPKADQIMAEDVMTGDSYKYYSEKYQDLFDYLKVCGFEYPITLDTIDDVFDPINCELAHFNDSNNIHTWPYYINQSIYESVRDAHNVSWGFSYSNPTIARLRGGNLLGDMLSRMQQKQNSLSNMKDTSLNWVRQLKIYMYSAHDSTVNAFLSTLGAEHYTGGQPGYSACVLLELWLNETSKDYYITTYYRQNISDSFIPIQVKDCTSSLPGTCSFTDFYTRSVPFIPTDWAKECSISTSRTTTMFAFQGFSLLLSCLFVALMKQIMELSTSE